MMKKWQLQSAKNTSSVKLPKKPRPTDPKSLPNAGVMPW